MTSTTREIYRNRYYDVGDWLLYILLISLAICLPMVIDTIGWVPDAGRLIWISVFATAAGILLSLSPLPGWMIWAIGTGWGVFASIQLTVSVVPPGKIFWPELRHALSALYQLVARWQLPGFVPFANTASYIGERMGYLLTKIGVWYSVVVSGGASQETIALFLGMALLIWLLTFFACTELLRQRRTFLATIPLGLVVVLNVAYTGIGLTYVYAYMGLTLIAQIWAHARHLELHWKSRGTDYSPEIKRDMAITGTAITLAVVFTALIIPYFTINRVVWFFWENVGSRLKPLYQNWDRAFAGRNPVPTLEPKTQAGQRASHQVASSPGQPGERIVLLVTTSDPPPPSLEQRYIDPELRMGLGAAKHYWRQITYDTYSGTGWENQTVVENIRMQPDAKWTEVLHPYRVLTQTYTIVRGSPATAFAVNQPVLVNQEYRVTVRPNNDIESFGLITDTYTVVSYVPAASRRQLNEAGTAYPDWVTERYLQLPEIPPRVRETAARIVEEAGAFTPYEKAKAIEMYLRSFPYDLNVPPPPLGEDVTDYFLFTAQRGYCDYSATAMVVLLRAVGVPSRYASGYHMGTYDQQAQAFVVRENAAHAWAEVYFPGYGWIEFEPTPSQTVFEYTGLAEESESAGYTSNQAARTPFQQIPTILYGAIGLALALAFVILWPPRWFKRRATPAERQIIQIYEKMVSSAAWLGVVPVGGQTPAEFLWRLIVEVNRRSNGSLTVQRDIEFIRDAYLRARYSGAPSALEEAQHAQGAWRRLRGTVLRLAFSSKPAPPVNPAI